MILQGYDAVSYFTVNKAQLGDSKYEARYNGATYWFTSDAHASMFKDHPEMFAPQYGAFCGYAMSLNKLRPIDPLIWQIVDGRLILQHTQDAYDQDCVASAMPRGTLDSECHLHRPGEG